MQYSIEESALIGGLITEYFSRASVSDSVRLAYRQVYQHLMDGHLTQDDLGRIQAALDFLLPRGASENKSHAEKKSLKVKQANQNIPVDTLPKWKCASAIGVISLPCHLHLRWYGRFSALSAASNATYRTRRSSTGGL